MKGDTMPEFSTMLDLQAQMMLLLAIGVFLAKKKLITDQGRACLTDLLLFIILPANIIQSFRIETPHSLPEFDFPIYSIYERPGHFIAEMCPGLVTVL